MRCAVLVAALGAAFLLEGVAAADGRRLCLRDAHTGVELHLQPFGRGGVPRPVPWARANHFLRDKRTRERRPVNPRLLRILAQLQRHFRVRCIEVYSTYRAPAAGAPLENYHQVGRAADIRIPGVADRDAFEYCRRTLGHVGCGLYPFAIGIHVDVRSTAAIWVQVGGDAARPVYAENPGAWLDAHPGAARGR